MLAAEVSTLKGETIFMTAAHHLFDTGSDEIADSDWSINLVDLVLLQGVYCCPSSVTN